MIYPNKWYIRLSRSLVYRNNKSRFSFVATFREKYIYVYDGLLCSGQCTQVTTQALAESIAAGTLHQWPLPGDFFYSLAGFF